MGRIPVVMAMAGMATGCGASDRAGGAAAVVVERPDSAGWRFARLRGLDLALRYPVSRVGEVRDQSAGGCDSLPPLFAAHPDTTQDGMLIAARGPADFRRVAEAAGFERETRPPNVVCTGDGCDLEHWVVREDGPLYAQDYAEALAGGPWRGLIGVAGFAGYWDDEEPDSGPPEPADTVERPEDEADVRASPEPVYQARWFALAPAAGGCAVVLAWRGALVRETRGGEAAATWDSATIGHLLLGSGVGLASKKE